MEVTRQALKGMKSATKDVHAKANEQSHEEKKYNRATSKPKPSHWKPLGKNDYENMRNGNVDGLSDEAYRKAKYEELKESDRFSYMFRKALGTCYYKDVKISTAA